MNYPQHVHSDIWSFDGQEPLVGAAKFFRAAHEAIHEDKSVSVVLFPRVRWLSAVAPINDSVEVSTVVLVPFEHAPRQWAVRFATKEDQHRFARWLFDIEA